MPRKLLLQKYDEVEIMIEIPDDAKVTFGPFCPPTKSGGGGNSSGTLRVYQGTKDNIIAVITSLVGFRDPAMYFAEKIAVEVGDTIWKDNRDGYKRTSSVEKRYEWKGPVLEAGSQPKRKKKK